MHNKLNMLLNSTIFILICVILQVFVFAFIIYSSAISSLRLEQIVILSRHNVRTPLSKNLHRMTQQSWPQWKENPGFLTENGFALEEYMGEYFSAWLKHEKLLPKHCPNEEDFYVYANSLQRTMKSAQAFVTKCFPNCNITINHSDVNKPDPIFSPFIHNSSVMFQKIALKEMKCALGKLHISYEPLENILKFNESDFCKIDNVCNLDTERNEFNIHVGKKPKISGPLKIGNEAMDAFLMAYYNGFPAEKVAWGKLNTATVWSSILDINKSYHNVEFNTTHIAKDIALPLIRYLTEIFKNKNTKVTLLMGHDANIYVILNALLFKPYILEESFISTPLGGKVVFQKWFDEKINDFFLKIDYVFSTNEQIRKKMVLSMDNPPQFKLLELMHCKVDDRGFCLWKDFINFLNSL